MVVTRGRGNVVIKLPGFTKKSKIKKFLKIISHLYIHKEKKQKLKYF